MKTKKKVVDREMTAKREEMAAYFGAIAPARTMTPAEKVEYDREMARRLATLDQAVEVEEVLEEFRRLCSSNRES